MIKSDTFHGLNMSDWLSAMDETVAALNGLSELVVSAMGHGDDMQRCAYGISSLFRAQFDDAREMLDDLRSATFPRREAAPTEVPVGQNMVMRRHANGDALIVPASDFHKPEPDHPDYAAVKASNAEILAALHETQKVERDFLRDPSPAAQELRNRVVADKLEAGFDANQIAQAVNLKAETVERVIAQMLATTLQAKPDDETGRAVNE